MLRQDRGLGFEHGQSLGLGFKLTSASVVPRRGHHSGENDGVDATQEDKVRGLSGESGQGHTAAVGAPALLQKVPVICLFSKPMA